MGRHSWGGAERRRLAGELAWQRARETRRPQSLPRKVQGTTLIAVRDHSSKEEKSISELRAKKLTFLPWSLSLSRLGQHVPLGCLGWGTRPWQEQKELGVGGSALGEKEMRGLLPKPEIQQNHLERFPQNQGFLDASATQKALAFVWCLGVTGFEGSRTVLRTPFLFSGRGDPEGSFGLGRGSEELLGGGARAAP